MLGIYSRAAIGLALSPVSVISAQGSRPGAAAIAHAVDSLTAQAVREGLAPALGVAIVMDGKTIYSKSHGSADLTAGIKADDKTLWYIASTSKSFAGFAVSLLERQGALSFETPITKLLPQVKWHPDVHADSITLKQLLSHTHRVDDDAVGLTQSFTGEIPEQRWPDLIQIAGRTPTNELIYTNFGYNVAGMVIDRLRPEKWRQYLEQNIFAPVGMRETYARVSAVDPKRIARPHDYRGGSAYVTAPFYKVDATIGPAGGHLATLHDLARWTIVQADSGVIDGRRVFPKDAIILSHTLLARHTRDQSKRFAFFDRDGWAAGWDIGTYEGERMVSRFGSYHTTRSHLSFLPARRIGAVVMSTGGLSVVTDIIAAFAYDLEAGRPDARQRADARLTQVRQRMAGFQAAMKTQDSVRAERRKVPLGHPLRDFAGSYQDPSFGTLVFTLQGDSLYYRWGAVHGPVEVFDATKNQLRIEVAGGGVVAEFSFPSANGPAETVDAMGARLVRVR